MEVTRKSRRQVRLQSILFAVLFMGVLGLLAWLSTRYHYQADWTATGRNTLSQASVALLKEVRGPVTVIAFAREAEPLRKRISEVVGLYQRHKSDMRLNFVNPDAEPDKVREQGITSDGEMVIQYAGRMEKIKDLGEQSLTNALQRLARGGERWIVFLEGHGERNPHGRANHDLGSWIGQVEVKGFKAQTINLASHPQIPANATALVVAGPQVDLLPGEVKLIQDYVAHGGNLLWLGDPGSLHGLKPLAQQLGVEFLPGVIVDPATQAFSINNPAFALVADYGGHPVTQGFNVVTLFPLASGLKLTVPAGWDGLPFLMTGERSWSESGRLSGEISFNQGGDVAGPLAIGVSLNRAVKDAGGKDMQQRVVVLGDGDFLSNAYLGNGGNLNLGMNIVNWLSHDDSFIAIPVKTAPDLSLNLSQTHYAVIGIGFLVAIPAMLAGSGLLIWLRRRKR